MATLCGGLLPRVFPWGRRPHVPSAHTKARLTQLTFEGISLELETLELMELRHAKVDRHGASLGTYAGWQPGPTHRGLQPVHVRLQGCCSTARAKVPSTGRNATPCLPCANHVRTMCLQEEDVAFGGRATNRSPRKFWSVSLLFDQATQLN